MVHDKAMIKDLFDLNGLSPMIGPQEPVGESNLTSSDLFPDWTASGCIDDIQRYRLLRRPCQSKNRSLSGQRCDSPTHS
jgi:hypothetical protein